MSACLSVCLSVCIFLLYSQPTNHNPSQSYIQPVWLLSVIILMIDRLLINLFYTYNFTNHLQSMFVYFFLIFIIFLLFFFCCFGFFTLYLWRFSFYVLVRVAWYWVSIWKMLTGHDGWGTSLVFNVADFDDCCCCCFCCLKQINC